MSKLNRLIGDQRLDGLLIGNLTNVRYLTDFTGSAGSLVVRPTEATLFVDGRYTEQAQQQFADGRVETTPRDILGGVITSLRQSRLQSRLGFESRHLPHEQWRRVTEALEGIELVPTLDLIEGLRSRKDEKELAAIRRAVWPE